MTPEKIALVQGSFKKVAPIAEPAADIFYDKLFELDPALRSLFPEQMGDQKKKLMQMLATAVNNLHQVDSVLPAVQELGRRHVAYGITAPMYDTVGAALLFTLEKGLGDDWTPEVAEAWAETYGLVAGVMKDAAAEVPVAEAAKKGFLSRMFAR
ncbi:globin family protein [Rhodovulum sp. DZ06]|uniref:globin family protein n=1 Tax=Rhodovulum sp. DZ06 TaxID=3425126 RepID=UPI003D327475